MWRDVGEQRRRVVEAADRLASEHEARAVCERALDVAGDPLERDRVDQRAVRRVGVARVADLDLGCPCFEPLQELVEDRGLDEEARAGQAHLARVVVLVGRGRRRRVEVRVLEHDERRLAAELERHRGQVRGGVAVDRVRGGGGAGERDPVDVLVSRERCPGAGARAVDDVEHPGREAGLLGEVAEQRARQRRPLGRLQHDGVAGGERRADAPGREHERRVPGRRDGDDAGRVVADPVALAAVQRARRLGQAVAREVGEEADVVGRAREHAQAHRLVQRAVVDALDLGQVGDGVRRSRPRVS